MKKLLLFFFAVSALISSAQTQPAPLIWGASPYQDSIWAFDTTSWAPAINVQPTVTGSVVAGINGLAYDPTSYVTYAILKMSSGPRQLATVNLNTGACTIVGSLGDSFSSITFDSQGQLYGATGDGASVPETLYRINKATATSTVVFAMGNGNDGEIICYNRYDNKMYHWSGNGTLVFESWPNASTSYTPTNITTSGNVSSETFGAVCLGLNKFVVSTISSEMQYLNSGGLYGNPVNSCPDDIRGLVMPPRFATSTKTICAKTGAFNVFANCLQLFDSVYVNWGDGNLTQSSAAVATASASSHTFTNAGTYTVTVQLYNGAVPKSTFITYTVLVNTSPNVSITGNNKLCPNSTLTLSASGGGSSQWYLNGTAITGSTANTVTVSTAGWYNMVKTNQNGCSDSALVGVNVVNVPSPTVTVVGGTICLGQSFTISPSGANTYTFEGGNAVVSPTTTTSYSVVGTGTNGCKSFNTPTCTVTVNALPTLSLSTTNATICAGETATLTVSGATSYSWNATTTGTSQVVSPTSSTTYSVVGSDANNCQATQSIVQNVSECTGISKYASNQLSATLYPNPTSGKLTLKGNAIVAEISVYNALGELVLNKKTASNEIGLSIEAFSNGVYFLTAKYADNSTQVIKFIKE